MLVRKALYYLIHFTSPFLYWIFSYFLLSYYCCTATLRHSQKFLQYTIVEFTRSIILLFPSPLFLEQFQHVSFFHFHTWVHNISTTFSFLHLFLIWDRVLWTVSLGWLWTMILLISASWVAGITGVRHHAQLFITIEQSVYTTQATKPRAVYRKLICKNKKSK
jgi:hypothetical protein